MSSTALNPLVEKVRSAHPGAYDDMDDAALTKRVLAKYPQYSDLAAPKLPATGTGAPPNNPINSANPEDFSAEGLLKGFAKNLYQISAPGIATSVIGKQAPELAQHIPAIMRENAAPPENLPGQIVMNAAPMMIGDEVQPEAGVESAARPSPDGTPGAAGRIGRVLARRIPGVKLGEDLLDAIKGPAESPPAPATPSVPSTWGKGVYGTPISEWGERIPSSPEAPPPSTEAPTSTAPKVRTPVYRDATRSNVPYAGEAPAGRIKATPEPSAQPVQQPPQPLTTPISRSRADLMEDKGIQESMQGDLEGHGIQAHKQVANEAAQYRLKNIRQAVQQRGGIASANPDEDLTESWGKAVEDLKRKRAQK